MIDPTHALTVWIRPALKHIELWSVDAEVLVLGTAMVESDLRYLKQQGSGPALGIFQIEPATHQDVWKNWLAHRPSIQEQVGQLMAEYPTPTAQLATNPLYAAAICRIIYRRDPRPLPAADNFLRQAQYWKSVYNTVRGKGKSEDYLVRARAYMENKI